MILELETFARRGSIIGPASSPERETHVWWGLHKIQFLRDDVDCDLIRWMSFCALIRIETMPELDKKHSLG